MDLLTFERKRLQLFRDNGFAGEGRRVADRVGRETYLIGRGEGQRPTILVHGGLSEASKWFRLAERIPGRVIIADRPGCGLSYRIDYRGLDFRTEAADWLLDLADGLDATQRQIIADGGGEVRSPLAHQFESLWRRPRSQRIGGGVGALYILTRTWWLVPAPAFELNPRVSCPRGPGRDTHPDPRQWTKDRAGAHPV